MGLLDPIPERFVPKEKKYKPKDNFTDLQNLNRKEVTEDFADSPFADRKEKLED
jgi:hypothetical protein